MWTKGGHGEVRYVLLYVGATCAFFFGLARFSPPTAHTVTRDRAQSYIFYYNQRRGSEARVRYR